MYYSCRNSNSRSHFRHVIDDHCSCADFRSTVDSYCSKYDRIGSD